MQDLRLIGVQEDGGHLLLADEHGSRFRVALDEQLRAAARHQRHHGQVPLDGESGHRPRDVQALIRAGLTAQEVAERCGWPVEKVHKYEVPILAEREYVSGLARLVRLRSRGPSAQGSPTLAGRVADRLQARGVDPDEVSWDAHRQAGSEWTVLLTFPAGGRQRQATWGFDPSTHAIHPRDDEARWFSEDDPSAEQEVVVREIPVYDVEAEGGVGADSRAEHTVAGSDPLDLVTAMRQRTNARSRRGSRRRAPEGVALPLDGEHNGAEPAAETAAPQAFAAAPAPVVGELLQDKPAASGDGLVQAAAEDAEDPPNVASTAAEATLFPGSASPDDAQGSFGQPFAVDPPTDAGPPSSPEPVSTEAPVRAGRRSGRIPVPSWEDVVLGTKPSSD